MGRKPSFSQARGGERGLGVRVPLDVGGGGGVDTALPNVYARVPRQLFFTMEIIVYTGSLLYMGT